MAVSLKRFLQEKGERSVLSVLFIVTVSVMNPLSFAASSLTGLPTLNSPAGKIELGVKGLHFFHSPRYLHVVNTFIFTKCVEALS